MLKAKFDKRYVSLTLFNRFDLLYVRRKGSYGNCYSHPTLRFETGWGVHHALLTYASRNRETQVCFTKWYNPLSWSWNSEHLASKWGDDLVTDESLRCGGPTMHYRWESRFFGTHEYI